VGPETDDPDALAQEEIEGAGVWKQAHLAGFGQMLAEVTGGGQGAGGPVG
jgi:hypothetical protein